MTSTFRPLEDRRANSILNQSDAHKRDLNKDGWIDWDALKEALQNNRDAVVMHGKAFTIKECSPRYAHIEYYVQRVDHLTPAGWFTMDQVNKKCDVLSQVIASVNV